MKEIHFWNFILSELKKKRNIVLAIVVDHGKGSPGKQGFKMAVSSEEQILGSIGGGIMEYELLKKCRNALKENIILNELETLHHKKIKSLKKSGLICSGFQTNYLLTLTEKNLPVLLKISESLENNKPGKITLNYNGLSFKSLKIPDSKPKYQYKNKDNWKYEQPTGSVNIVYIIGGGHVGNAVSKVLSMLNFYIILIDNRSDLKLFSKNRYADEILNLKFDELEKTVQENSYVIIVTTGFESDKTAIMQLINKDLKYIGLMGTKVKIKKIYSEVVKSGINKELLKKIKAPIGLDIGSDTPEEIAVSIAAEMIKIKNQ